MQAKEEAGVGRRAGRRAGGVVAVGRLRVCARRRHPPPPHAPPCRRLAHTHNRPADWPPPICIAPAPVRETRDAPPPPPPPPRRRVSRTGARATVGRPAVVRPTRPVPARPALALARQEEEDEEMWARHVSRILAVRACRSIGAANSPQFFKVASGQKQTAHVCSFKAKEDGFRIVICNPHAKLYYTNNLTFIYGYGIISMG